MSGAPTPAGARQYPRALTRRKTWRQQPIIDLTCNSETIEGGCREEQARIVREPIRCGVDVPFRSRDDAVVVHINASDLGSVRIEESPLQVLHTRLKGRRSFVHIQEDLVGQAARNATLTGLPLRIHIAVELIRIARQRRIITDYIRLIVDAARARSAPLKCP